MPLLTCPRCGSRVHRGGAAFRCSGACGTEYPMIDGVPILLDEEQSLFAPSDFVARRPTYFPARSLGARLAKRLVPALSANHGSAGNYARLRRLLLERGERPAVLVLGAGIDGLGFESVVDERIDIVRTDVALTDQTEIICDAHSIPFADGSFDAVVAQAVLEHVIDPGRCVTEIHRVLKPGGLVYAETPFMQQVHGGRYDFTRFTRLGHLALFRRFCEIDSGAIAGPGTALAWAWQYFLLAFFSSRSMRNFVKVVSRLTGWVFRSFDAILVKKPGGLDGASATFFLGERSETTRSDREIVGSYRGAV